VVLSINETGLRIFIGIKSAKKRSLVIEKKVSVMYKKTA